MINILFIMYYSNITGCHTLYLTYYSVISYRLFVCLCVYIYLCDGFFTYNKSLNLHILSFDISDVTTVKIAHFITSSIIDNITCICPAWICIVSDLLPINHFCNFYLSYTEIIRHFF